MAQTLNGFTSPTEEAERMHITAESVDKQAHQPEDGWRLRLISEYTDADYALYGNSWLKRIRAKLPWIRSYILEKFRNAIAFKEQAVQRRLRKKFKEIEHERTGR